MLLCYNGIEMVSQVFAKVYQDTMLGMWLKSLLSVFLFVKLSWGSCRFYNDRIWIIINDGAKNKLDIHVNVRQMSGKLCKTIYIIFAFLSYLRFQ